MAKRDPDAVDLDVDRTVGGRTDGIRVDVCVDVVVVGFGPAGATAALAAAEAGARVLVLDRRTLPAIPSLVGRPPTPGSEALGGPLAVRSGVSVLRARARAAGVEVRRCTTVGELLVEDGGIAGVGFMTVDPRTGPGARHWWLDRLGRWAARLPGGSPDLLERRADAVWREAASVGRVRAAAVVLGLDRAHWDFVGPAVWSAGLGRRAEIDRLALRRRLSVVPAGSPPLSPELRSRAWCARLAGADELVEPSEELGVEPATGRVRDAGGGVVPGLYSAVGPAPLGAAGSVDPGLAEAAGRTAAARRPRPLLRSAG